MQNMTVGSPAKQIIAFSIPLLIGNLFQQLYNISDILIVGRLIGVDALAAVGATAPIYYVLLLICFGFTGGLTVITAQSFGAGDQNGVRRSMTHAIMASTVLSLFITLCTIFSLSPLLKIMNIPANIMGDALRFMSVLTGGLVMVVFYNLLSGFIRAVGDSKTPLYFLVFSTVLNVVFNLVLIYYFKTGVVGSAIGTVSAISFSVVLCLYYIYKKFPIMHLSRKDWIYDPQLMRQHLKIAVPMAIQFSILSVSMMIIQSVCNSFGTDIIAAFTSALRIEQLATQPLLALGIAMATFSAQNWGAGKISRIRRGVRIAALISLAISICMSLLVRYVGSDMIAIFLKDESPFIIETGKKYLSISTLAYFFLGMIFVFRNTLQGMGNAIIPLYAGFIELAMRSFAAIYLARVLGYTGIFYASPIAWVGAALFTMAGYYVTIYHLKEKKNNSFFRKNIHHIRLKASINCVNQTPGE